MPEAARVDAVIVGAGFTGLTLAAALRRAGRSVAVLEAATRVGGRVLGGRIGPRAEPVDLGGGFFCQDMPHVLALARAQGRAVREPELDGEVRVQPSGMDPARARPDPQAGEVGEAWEHYDAMDRLDLAAARASGASVAEWIEGLGLPEAGREALYGLFQGAWCRPAATIPLWHMIDQRRRTPNEVSELQYIAPDGLHAMAETIAAELGEAVRLGEPVLSVRHGPEGVEARTASGTWRGRVGVVTLSPVVVPRIAFEPALPSRLAGAIAAYGPCDIIKMFVRYEAAPWRDRGWSGTVRWRQPGGVYVCDVSPSDDAPTLTAFIGGTTAREWHGLGPEGRRQRLLAMLVPALGEEASRPLDVVEHDWVDDPLTGGGYNALVADPTAVDAEDILREGAGPLRFAVSELAPVYPGYVDGAIAMGEAAAADVLDRLG